ncbi:MAG: DNA polymerase III subunit gamma/tau, partial [Bacteroidota bacterium]
AFNALLKTLEEPPPYALFVFATTEPHKVLPTILSRTQRFDFRRIQVPEIVSRLREVCEAEGITADDDSLVLIARKGDGALRDALSLFDQSVSLCGMNLQIGPLREALGVVDEDVFFAVTERAAQGDRAGLVTLIDGIVRRGYDLAEFVDGLGGHLRDLMVTRSTGDPSLVEGTEATRARYGTAARDWAEADLLHLLMLAERCASDLRDSRQPRLTVELALVKMATLERAARLDVLLERLRTIEAALAGGATLPASVTTDGRRTKDDGPRAADYEPTSSPPSPTRSPLPEGQGEGPSTAPSAPAPASVAPPAASVAPPAASVAPPAASVAPPAASVAPPAASAPSPLPAPAPRRETTAVPEAHAAAPPPPTTTAEPPEAYRPHEEPPDEGGLPVAPEPPPAPAPAAPARPAPAAPADPGVTLFGRPALAPRPSSGDGAATEATLVPPPAEAPADPDFGISIARVRGVWREFVQQVRAEHGPRLFSMLAGAEPLRVRRGTLEVGVASPLATSQLGASAEALSAAMGALVGQAVPLAFVVERSASAETARPDDPFETLKRLRQEDPVVRALFDELGAEIVYT